VSRISNRSRGNFIDPDLNDTLTYLWQLRRFGMLSSTTVQENVVFSVIAVRLLDLPH
jgi:hypothetical protein